MSVAGANEGQCQRRRGVIRREFTVVTTDADPEPPDLCRLARLTPPPSRDIYLLMTTRAKVFASGRSQAIRLPKEFRVSGKEVRLTRVPGGILIREGDPWDAFDEGCQALGGEFFEAVERRDRKTVQIRDFNAGLP